MIGSKAGLPESLRSVIPVLRCRLLTHSCISTYTHTENRNPQLCCNMLILKTKNPLQLVIAVYPGSVFVVLDKGAVVVPSDERRGQLSDCHRGLNPAKVAAG